MTAITVRGFNETESSFTSRHAGTTVGASDASNKLSTMVVINGQKFGPIVDVRDPGESDEAFVARHMVHVTRWVRTNYPDGDWTEIETTWGEE